MSADTKLSTIDKKLAGGLSQKTEGYFYTQLAASEKATERATLYREVSDANFLNAGDEGENVLAAGAGFFYEGLETLEKTKAQIHAIAADQANALHTGLQMETVGEMQAAVRRLAFRQKAVELAVNGATSMNQSPSRDTILAIRTTIRDLTNTRDENGRALTLNRATRLENTAIAKAKKLIESGVNPKFIPGLIEAAQIAGEEVATDAFGAEHPKRSLKERLLKKLNF